MSEESYCITHARQELEVLERLAAEDNDPSAVEMQKHVTRDVLKVLKAISETGQSGGSIGYFLNLVKKCALQEPLTPIYGDDSEWSEVSTGMWQNKRNSSVFKDKEGRAYDVSGHIGVDPDGWTYTGGGKATICYITFPYTSSRKYYPRPELLVEHGHILSFEDSLKDTAEEVLDLYDSLNISRDSQ